MRFTTPVFASLLLVLLAAADTVGAQPVRMGPSGSYGGDFFSDSVQTSERARVAKVQIRAGKLIDGLQIIYRTPDGGEIAGEPHGGRGGRISVFELRPDEFITKITGRFGGNLDSIQFHTSHGRSSDVYGGDGGRSEYLYEAPNGYEIAGFIGRAGYLIDAIGVVMRPR